MTVNSQFCQLFKNLLTGRRAAEATDLENKLDSFPFMFSLHVIHEVLAVINPLSEKFYEDLDRVVSEFEERFSVQMPVLEATRCFNPKSEEFMNTDLLLEITTYFDKADIDVIEKKL